MGDGLGPYLAPVWIRAFRGRRRGVYTDDPHRSATYGGVMPEPQTRPQVPHFIRSRTRGDVHPGRSPVPRQRASEDSLACARAARILAERQLEMAIHRAESQCEEIAKLGRDFDRRLEKSKAMLLDAGYLQRPVTAYGRRPVKRTDAAAAPSKRRPPPIANTAVISRPSRREPSREPSVS